MGARMVCRARRHEYGMFGMCGMFGISACAAHTTNHPLNPGTMPVSTTFLHHNASQRLLTLGHIYPTIISSVPSFNILPFCTLSPPKQVQCQAHILA